MEKKILNQINQVVLAVLYRGMRVLYRHDSRIKEEMDSWEKGLTLKLACGPNGAALAIRQDDSKGVSRLRSAQKADITMRFKSVSGAFQVLSGQVGISDAYARHLFSLEGDIYQTMSFVRCMEYIEAYLFPKFITKRILREVPEKQMSALQVYALAAVESGR